MNKLARGEFAKSLSLMGSETDPQVSPGGSGGGGSSDMERRISALESDMKEVKASLKEILSGQKDILSGQTDAAIKSVENTGAANTRHAELGTRFMEIDGKINALTEVGAGLRRDLEKLPTEYGVAKIMVFVVGGLGAGALLLKNGWPLLSKIFGP